MPALAYEIATLSTPFTRTGTAGDSYSDIGCTVTLTAGRWLVKAVVSHQNRTGGGSVTISSEVELRHESTRIGVARWCNTFGGFVSDSNQGHSMRVFAVVDVAGGDTISIWLRRNDSGGAAGAGDVIAANDAVLEAINLDLLTEGVDYVYSEGANSDTVDAVAGDATWVALSAASRVGQGASEVPYTAPDTGDYWVIGSMEAFISGTAAATERHGGRLRLNGATIGTGETFYTNVFGVPTTYIGNFFQEDVISLTASDQPEIQWEGNNDASGDAAGFRRARIFVLRLAALSDYAFVVNAGNLQIASGGNSGEAANGLTFDFGTAAPVLISGTASIQHGGGNWSRSWLHQDAGDVHWPTLGRTDVWADEAMGSGDDYMSMHFTTIISQTGSVTWRFAKSTDSGANSSALGRTRGDGASARTPLVALMLAIPDSGNVDGTCTAAIGLAATFGGTAAATGTCTASTTMSATFLGAAAVAGQSAAQIALAATFRGTAAVQASCNAAIGLAATFQGTAAIASTCTAAIGLSATFTGATGSSTTIGVAVDLSATFLGAAAASGQCSAGVALAATFLGAAAVSGQIAASVAFSADFSGSTSSSPYAGTIAATTAFAATFTGIGAFSGALQVASSFEWAVTSPIVGKTRMSIRQNVGSMTIARRPTNAG